MVGGTVSVVDEVVVSLEVVDEEVLVGVVTVLVGSTARSLDGEVPGDGAEAMVVSTGATASTSLVETGVTAWPSSAAVATTMAICCHLGRRAHHSATALRPEPFRGGGSESGGELEVDMNVLVFRAGVE